MHTNIEIIRKYRKLLRKKKRLNSLLFSYLHCDSKLVELYKNAYITTVRNVATWSKEWEYGDPETGGLAPRTYSLGINLTF